MFNREYQTRATEQGIRSFLAQEFYRPMNRPDPKVRRGVLRGQARYLMTAKGEQLKLDFDSDKPLNDLFPEAYQ